MKKNIILKAATVAVALMMASSFLTACGSEQGAAAINDLPLDDTCVDGVAKPEKIIMMVDTFMKVENMLFVRNTKRKQA